MSVLVFTELLEAAPAVTAIVGARITPEWRNQGDPLPAINVTQISATRTNTLTDASTLTESVVQVDCWANSYREAHQLARAVRDALDQRLGVIAGVSVDRIALSTFRDLGEKTGDKSIRRVSLDFNCWYQEV